MKMIYESPEMKISMYPADEVIVASGKDPIEEDNMMGGSEDA